MAAITTDYFLDDAAATGIRTAGESWSIAGCKLTIRTDTRWYPGAPANMTGSIGAIGMNDNLGGELFIDGTNVRWLAYDSGAGNVPGINTTITQGEVTGILLGVWADLTSAPTAVGAAMPVTGWLKFRQVTGGVFSPGTLTGIGAFATSADTTGWIEVVLRSGGGTTLQFSRLGNGFITDGAWFELGITSGSPGQIIQSPTNGSSSTTIAGVQIETAPGSGVYEWWPAITSATTFTTAHQGTGLQSKVVQQLTNGQVRIGSDGSNNIGYVPPFGCKIRIPNILLRFATSGTDAQNLAAGSGLRTSSGIGKIVLKNVLGDLWSTLATGQVNVSIYDSALAFTQNFNGIIENFTFSNVMFGGPLAVASPLTIQDCLASFTLTNVVVAAGALSTTGNMAITNCTGFTINGLFVLNTRSRTSTNGFSFLATGCFDFQMQNVFVMGSPLRLNNCRNVIVTTVDYTDRMVGTVNSNQPVGAVSILSCTDIVLSGFTFGLNGAVADQNCYGAVFTVQTCNGLILVRNAGTPTSPIPVSSSNAIGLIGNVQTSDRVSLQRLFFSSMRSGGVHVAVSSMLGSCLMESVEVTGSTTNSNLERRTTLKMTTCNFNISSLQRTNAIGSIMGDILTNNTSGFLYFVGNPPSAENAGSVTLNVTPNPGTGYAASGRVLLKTINDEIVYETSIIKGYTSFPNTAPVLNGNGMATILAQEYQIDTGAGWSSWKTLNGANLSAESISPAGFKLRMRVRCISTNTNAAFDSVLIPITTSAAAREANLYPLDTVTITLTGLQPGSEVRAYVGTDPSTAIEIAGVESSGTSFTFNHSNTGQTGFIRVFALGYQPINYSPYTYSAQPAELLVQQVIDRNYVNPA